MNLFSASPENSINSFLRQYAFYLALGIALIILIVVTILLIVNFVTNKKNSPKETKETSASFNDELFFASLGGLENITSYQIKGNRLYLYLKDVDLFNCETIKNVGVTSFIKMSQKVALLGLDNQNIAAILKQYNVPNVE